MKRIHKYTVIDMTTKKPIVDVYAPTLCRARREYKLWRTRTPKHQQNTLPMLSLVQIQRTNAN